MGRGVDGKPHEWVIDVSETPTTEVAARLWARMRLKDVDVEDRDAQVAMSLRYGVVCSATAFVAVSLKEVPGQKPERVDIPVLLPETWSEEAFRGVFAGAAAACAFAGPSVSSLAGGFDPPETAPRSRRLVGGFLGGSRHSGAKLPMTPPQPPKPLPSSTGASRPQLLVDAEAFLERLKDGGAVADAEWQRFVTALKAELLQGWSDLDRARFYEVLVTLRTYGRHAELPKALEVEPADVDARRSWRRARQALGHATP